MLLSLVYFILVNKYFSYANKNMKTVRHWNFESPGTLIVPESQRATYQEFEN